MRKLHLARGRGNIEMIEGNLKRNEFGKTDWIFFGAMRKRYAIAGLGDSKPIKCDNINNLFL